MKAFASSNSHGIMCRLFTIPSPQTTDYGSDRLDVLQCLASDEFGIGRRDGLRNLVAIHPVNTDRAPRLSEIAWLVATPSVIVVSPGDSPCSCPANVDRLRLELVI